MDTRQGSPCNILHALTDGLARPFGGTSTQINESMISVAGCEKIRIIDSALESDLRLKMTDWCTRTDRFLA